MAYKCSWCRSWVPREAHDPTCPRLVARDVRENRYCPVCGESRPDHNYVCDGGFGDGTKETA